MAFLEFHKQRIDEMGIIRDGYEGHSTSLEHDWTNEKWRGSFIVIKDNFLSSKHLKLFRNGIDGNFFILTDKENNYIGSIQFKNIKNKIAVIDSSYSKMTGGFYNIMFTAILGLADIEEILSDVILSDKAFYSYEKLQKNNIFNIKVKLSNEYFTFNRKNYEQDYNCRISIRESRSIREVFIDLDERILVEHSPYKNSKDNNTSYNDWMFLFGESFEDINFGDS